jgi:hypothetical protein
VKSSKIPNAVTVAAAVMLAAASNIRGTEPTAAAVAVAVTFAAPVTNFKIPVFTLLSALASLIVIDCEAIAALLNSTSSSILSPTAPALHDVVGNVNVLTPALPDCVPVNPDDCCIVPALFTLCICTRMV